jgi:hypothetical protein
VLVLLVRCPCHATTGENSMPGVGSWDGPLTMFREYHEYGRQLVDIRINRQLSTG